MKSISKRFLPKLIFLVSILFCSGLFAQAPIGFGAPGLLGMPDTAWSSPNTIQVGSYIKNYDNTITFTNNDTIQIDGYIDTLGGPPIPFSFPAVSNFSLAPGDSIFFLLPFVFLDSSMGGDFRIGNNVIVVWPVSLNPGFVTHDSISVNIFIIDPNGLPEYHQEEGVRFYPVPASGPLYVTTGTHSLIIKQVIVRDAAGKIVAVSDTPSLGIKTDDWASGIYMLEITFENGQKSNYKIIR